MKESRRRANHLILAMVSYLPIVVMSALPLRNFTVLGALAALTVTSLVGYLGYSYTSRKPVTKPSLLKYPVPSIWQHPSAIPGEWQQTIVVAPAPGGEEGRYIKAAYHNNKDYVMDEGTSVDANYINAFIEKYIAKDYRQINFEEYKRCYGFQNLQDGVYVTVQ